MVVAVPLGLQGALLLMQGAGLGAQAGNMLGAEQSNQQQQCRLAGTSLPLS